MIRIARCFFGFMLLIVFVQPFFFCEKDDICESTVEKTPLLVIQFFDGENIQSQTPKNVNDLRIIAPEFIGIENHTPLFFDGVSEIKIPLKIDQDETEFYFYLNADNADLNLRNTDKINIKYTRDDIYISRACGYKTYFELDFLDPFLFSEPIENVAYPDGGALWIRSINIVNTEINQDEAAHIYIYF